MMPDHTSPTAKKRACGAGGQNIGHIAVCSIALALFGVLLGVMAGFFLG